MHAIGIRQVLNVLYRFVQPAGVEIASGPVALEFFQLLHGLIKMLSLVPIEISAGSCPVNVGHNLPDERAVVSVVPIAVVSIPVTRAVVIVVVVIVIVV